MKIKSRKFFLILMTIISLTQLLNNKYCEASISENLPEPIYRVKTDKNEVALTFDINWAEKDYIYEILDILEKYEVKSTFFVMGKWVIYPEGNKEKLIDIHKSGHEIGNHSYVHPDFSNISCKQAEDEINKTDKIIYDNIGIKTKLFRYPSGSYNENAKKSVNNTGHITIQWDVDSIDWKEDGADIEYKRIVEKIKPGSIVLFHNNAKYTPENLERLIINMKKEDYRFITVGEMIHNENYIINENGEQIKN